MENWIDVPGFGNHYQASSHGRVKTKQRQVIKTAFGKLTTQTYRERVLSPCARNKYGHQVVHLCVDGKRMNVSVHTMVLLAFHGSQPDLMVGCHNNGDPTDNRPENLRWDTQASNNNDRKMHGRYAHGEKHPEAKISKQDAIKIANGELTVSEATQLGISRSQFYRIKNSESWKHLNQATTGEQQ